MAACVGPSGLKISLLTKTSQFWDIIILLWDRLFILHFCGLSPQSPPCFLSEHNRASPLLVQQANASVPRAPNETPACPLKPALG